MAVPPRRPSWQASLRELAISGSGRNFQTKSVKQLEALPEEEGVVCITEETSEPRPASRMSSTVAIPHIHGLNGVGNGKEIDLFSRDALSQKFGQTVPSFPPIDTQGGEIIDVTEREEIDPVDGCRVQILTYVILSADKMTELTKTIRRKFQLDSIHSYSRIQMVNGQEVGMETTTSRLQRDIKGFAPMQVMSHRLQLDENDEQDQAISAVLRETHSRMQSMLSSEKEKFIALFPQLFQSIQGKETTPTKEVIYNPDGTITERSSTKKCFSSHFSKSETFIDGKKQTSKTRVRAVVEYQGPEGGYKVKLANGDEGDLSEDETEEDDRSSALSEIRDDESGLFPLTPYSSAQAKSIQSAASKRLEKAWHAAKELVDSEERYVEKLKLLEEMFRKRIVAENALEKDKIVKLFANTESLCTFHNQHLLPQLMVAIRDWNTTKRISNTMRKQAPFLKMYSEYTNNYKRACKLFEEAMLKKKRFAEIVKEIEKDPACENLPLMSHLICPVQRVMRYQLLLQEYKKHLVESDGDYTDTCAALDLVMEAASHANEMMKKLDGYGKVIEVQEQLGNAYSLVHPGRELLRTGTLQKICSKTLKTEERFVFLFNDLIVLASERALPGFSKYKLRAVFHAAHAQVWEGDNLEREHSFYLRGSDGSGQNRMIELFCETQKEKDDWVKECCKIIDDASHSLASSCNSNRTSLYSEKGGSEKNCAECDEEFGFMSRGYRCSQCQRKLCKKCFGRYRHESKTTRACEACVKHMGSARGVQSPSAKRQDLLAVPACASPDNAIILHSAPVRFRGSLGKSLKRHFVIRSNFCLYSYNSPDDVRALAMLPLTGCEVKMTGEKNTFSLRTSSRRLYMITAEDDHSQARWMAVLDTVANAPLSGTSSEDESVSS